MVKIMELMNQKRIITIFFIICSWKMNILENLNHSFNKIEKKGKSGVKNRNSDVHCLISV